MIKFKKYLFLFLLLTSSVAFSQTDPFKEFEKFKQQTQSDFQKYRDSIHQDYENFKKVAWKEFEVFKTGGRLKKPKPQVIPEAKPQEIPSKPTPLIVTKPIKVLPSVELPEDDFSRKITPDFRRKLLSIAKDSKHHSKINFYGATFNLFYDDIDFTLNTVSNEGITEVVKQLSSRYETLDKIITQCVNYAHLMKLNGYGFLQLLRKTGYKIYADKKKATLFTWYVLNKMEFDVKVGYNRNKHLFLMTPSKVKFLNTFNIRQNRKRYYVLNFDNNDLHEMKTNGVRSYTKNPFKTKKLLSFLFRQAPQISEERRTRERGGKGLPFKIDLAYNTSYVELLKELPTLDYQAYFHIPVSEQTERFLEQKLNPLLQNKTNAEKVNFLLHLVQYGFEYQYDKENFGRIERPQAPEEMLYYKYSDCEDHSALFAYLVNHFTDCEVVGILYSSHVTTAVKFPNSHPNGYYLPKPHQDYLVCDATYIGANIGQCMPKFINEMPEAVFRVKTK
ncbi:MAG: hypothetical protein KGV44_03665 [Flavobacteriaceae bacterium]|nr:hypothetical protein [Flavobacteriaceae bacterium]